MFNFLKNNLLWSQGTLLVAFTCISGICACFFAPKLIIPVIGFFIFCIYFFRYPLRICPQAHYDPYIIIAPADGTIVDIAHFSDNQDGYAWKISIFLSPLDVHVNWSPIAGYVQQIHYKPGKFVVAFAPKSSDINERNDLIIHNQYGKLLVRQIAGIVARRICCWVKPGDSLKIGDTFGMIRFGSRVDLFVPDTVALNVSKGERVYGGKTIMGRFLWR